MRLFSLLLLAWMPLLLYFFIIRPMSITGSLRLEWNKLAKMDTTVGSRHRNIIYSGYRPSRVLRVEERLSGIGPREISRIVHKLTQRLQKNAKE